eukprot:TRINITY_DN2152_c0_g5_i1.p1 TRINITY_DN2152_c0_g5~~TRINITY_DN2152_c0_g5_i1.p1  ORF type:complete len:709 (+),score=229.82 TRINITY_DN2152_c0_g5_i1:45-2129(+)
MAAPHDIELRDQEEIKWGGQYADEDKNYLNHQIHLEYFDLHIEGIQLLSNANLKLTPGHRYGLIGGNGVGKTTLLRHLAAKKFKGMWKEHQTVLLVGGGETGSDAVVIDEVMCGYKTADDAPTDLAAHPDSETAKCFMKKLEHYDFGEIKSQAFQILNGLGFNNTQSTETLVSHLSGGWKARLAIAKTLLLEPDLLLLDEPTNHLDIETSIWLQDFLATYKKILIIITHDLEPLNTICTDIIRIKDKTLTQYQGNYDGYLRTYMDLLAKQANMHEWEGRQKKRLEETIAYLQAKGDPAASQQIASKTKALNRLGQQKTATGRRWKWGRMGDRIVTPAVIEEEEIKFKFHSDKRVRELPEDERMLTASHISYTYPSATSRTLTNISVSVTPTSRIALIGKNGSGKTTLLSVLTGENAPTEGDVATMKGFRIGYYKQDHINYIPNDMTPVEYLCSEHPNAKVQEVRDQLGSFGITPTVGSLTCGLLSAGQKARVVLALVTFGRPSLLVLDEPTNHLDLESQRGLIEALKCFKAACIVVTHSEYLIQECCNEIWAFDDNHNFRVLTESFTEWKSALLRRLDEGHLAPSTAKKEVKKQDPPSSKSSLGPPKDLGGKKGVVNATKVQCRVCQGGHFTHQCDKKKEMDAKKEAQEVKRKERQGKKAEMKAALMAAPTTYEDQDGNEWNVVVPKGMKNRKC